MQDYKFKTFTIERRNKNGGVTKKEYVTVNERLKYFRLVPEFKGWSIEVSIERIDLSNPNNPDQVMMVAVIKDEKGRPRATGRAWEERSSSYINKTSFIENCETSAIGRALAFLGIGIEDSIATYEEVMAAQSAQRALDKDTKKIDTSGLVDDKKEIQDMANNLKPSPKNEQMEILERAKSVAVPFGKFKGKRLGEIPKTELQGWFDYMKTTDAVNDERNKALFGATGYLLGEA
jgi:hypothetical protein